MLQAHEDILYLTIAEYTALLALLKPLSVWVLYSPHNVMALLHSTPATSYPTIEDSYRKQCVIDEKVAHLDSKWLGDVVIDAWPVA